MHLTNQQLTTLKAAIVADPVLSLYGMSTDDHYAIAQALNQPASPAFIVWRTAVPLEEIMRNGMDWTRVDNLSVGKARIWDWLSRLGTLNPSQANVRAGIDATWVGTAADLAVRAAVYVHCKRSATRAEQLFATGTGTDAVPATMAVEGDLTYQDVETARNLP
jgi:hypothetical protein